jgi:hypothetical protein
MKKIRKECSIAINNISDSNGVSCEHAYDAPVINYNLKREKDISSISRLTYRERFCRQLRFSYIVLFICMAVNWWTGEAI